MTASREFSKEARELSEARIQFALKCMQTVMQRKASENIVFSPYSIYEGLLMVYFASSGDTEIHLRRILQLPDYIPKQDWILHHQWDINKTNRKKSKGYYDENICWITSTNRLKDIVKDVFHRNKLWLFECSDIPNVIKNIYKDLKNEIQHYIHNPVKLNRLNKDMDFILSSVLRCCGRTYHLAFCSHLSNTDYWRKPITVLSPKLGTFVTELPYIDKTLSMFLLFPAVQSYQVPNKWKVDQSISGLIERLTTKEGTDELRNVLDYPPQPPTENVELPERFDLEYDLSTDELLEDLGIRELLEPDKASLSNFTDEYLHLGGAMHRARIRLTSANIAAGAINIFFTKNKGSFKSVEGTYSQYKQSFVWLIYDRMCHTILFIGVMNENHQLPQVSSTEHTASSSNIV